MGWLFYAPSRASLIRDLTASKTYESGASFDTLRWTCVGNNLWAVQRNTRPDGTATTFVALYRMANSKHGWGHKDMDESVGPYHVNCPLSYLDGLSEPINEWSREWREKVREYHADRAKQREYAKALKYDDPVTIYGKPYIFSAHLGRGKLRVFSVTEYQHYTAKVTQLEVPDVG
jgi:hypothetical protein